MQNYLKDKKNAFLFAHCHKKSFCSNFTFDTIKHMIYWTYPMQQNKYQWGDLKKKQELKFVTVLAFYLVMWSLKLNYKDPIGC